MPWDPLVDYQMMNGNTRNFMSLWYSLKPVICKVRGFGKFNKESRVAIVKKAMLYFYTDVVVNSCCWRQWYCSVLCILWTKSPLHLNIYILCLFPSQSTKGFDHNGRRCKDRIPSSQAHPSSILSPLLQSPLFSFLLHIECGDAQLPSCGCTASVQRGPNECC